MKTLQWKAVINGRRGLNGVPYSATHSGAVDVETDMSAADDHVPLYDMLHELADRLEEENADMAILHSLQITIA